MIMNGDSDYAHAAIQAMAMELADIFEDHIIRPMDDTGDYFVSEGPAMCSEEGLEIMGDAFGDIMEDYRGAVFQHLLREFEERGIEYDMTQFGAEEE